MTSYYKVDLDGSAYTYGWTGSEPLKPGDRVEVPGNVVNLEPSVRRVIRQLDAPDYDVDKIKNILAKVETASEQYAEDLAAIVGEDYEDFAADAEERQRKTWAEQNYWDDMAQTGGIGYPEPDEEGDAFENYVAKEDHAARQRRWDGVDPSVDDVPEDAFRMMHKRYVDALPDEQRRDAEGYDLDTHYRGDSF